MSKKTIYLEDAIDAIIGRTNCETEQGLRAYAEEHHLRDEITWTGGIIDALDAIEALPSAQFEPNCKGCKHQPRFSHEEPCCTCACNYENKYKG